GIGQHGGVSFAPRSNARLIFLKTRMTENRRAFYRTEVSLKADGGIGWPAKAGHSVILRYRYLPQLSGPLPGGAANVWATEAWGPSDAKRNPICFPRHNGMRSTGQEVWQWTQSGGVFQPSHGPKRWVANRSTGPRRRSARRPSVRYRQGKRTRYA